MADIIEEILTKGKKPETFSGGLYGNAAAAFGSGGIRGAGVGGNSTFFQDLVDQDAREEAEDEELFRMLGVNDATAQDETVARAALAVAYQEAAAQRYADLVLMQPRSAEDIRAVQDVKDELVALGVTREQLEKAGVDSSRGISGVMGPSISGAVDQGIEKGSELFGLGAERLAGLIGADEALSSALLNLPNLGATFVFSDTGPKSPLITGQTPSGTQVGITDPYGIAELIGGIKTGDLGIYDVIGGGAGAVKAATTAYASDDDPNKKTGIDTGVNITLEGDGVDPNKVPEGGDAGNLNKDKAANAGVVSSRTVGPGLDAGPGPNANADPARVTLTPGPVSDAELDEILTIIGGRPAVPGGYDTPVLTSSVSPEVPADEVPANKTPSGGGGGGGGGGGLPEQSGVRTVSGGPGDLVDIAYLYDFADSLAQPFRVTDAEDEIEGRQVRRFQGGGNVFGLSDTQLGLLGTAVGGIFGGLSGSGDTRGSQGYAGGIPEYTASRELVPDAFAMEGRRPGEAGRRYFTDTQYTPVTDASGAPTIMGAEQLAAQNAAALARQQELQGLGEGLLGLYGQSLASQAAATDTATTDTATTDTATTEQTSAYERLPGQSDVSYDFMSGLTEALGIEDPAVTAFKETLLSPEESAAIQAGTTGPMLPTLESLNVDVTDTISEEEANLVFDVLDREFFTPEEVASFYGFTTDEVVDAYRGMGGTKFAQGGDINGYYLGGTTDGMADQIPATIDNMQPAALSDGEFVIPADVVSHLGNGNSDSGAQNLYSMMERVRKDRTGNPKQGRQIDPNKYLA